MSMRPWTPELVKIITDAHVEMMRGGRRRPAGRRIPRAN
jgi:hypothetical protein